MRRKRKVMIQSSQKHTDKDYRTTYTGEECMRTAVITDSNSGIFKDDAQRLGIHIIAMPVMIDGKTYYENENITRQEFFEALRKDKDISTSQPPVGKLIETFDEVLKSADEIVYIPMSSGLSGACQSAILTSQEYDGKVQVVDNRRISISQKQSVMEALKLVEEGKAAAEIKDILEQKSAEAVIFLTVSSLNQFRKSGRIKPTVAALGNLIHIHPVLRTDGGKFDAYTNAHGLTKARSAMIRAIAQARTTVFRNYTDDQLYIASADSYEAGRYTEKYKAYVQEQFPQYSYFHDPLPLSICGHTGADAIGIGMFPKP